MQTAQIEQSIATVEQQYSNYAIATQEDYAKAAAAVKEIKDRKKQIVDFFADSKAKAHAAWKAITTQEKSFTDQLDAVERTIKSKMSTYAMEQERIRREAEAKARREAEEKARKEQERLMAEAAKAEQSGDTAKAEETFQQAMQTQPAPVQPVDIPKPTAQGASTRKTWLVESVDKATFIAAAAKDSNLLQFISIDEGALKRAIINAKGEINLPGVNFREDVVIAIR